MSRLVDIWRRWVAFLGRREPATPLALFRIFVGLVVIHTYAMFFWTDSLPIWLHVDHGGIHPLTPKSWLIQLLGGATPEVVLPLLGVGVVSAITLTMGLFSRTSALVALQVSLALVHLLPSAGGGHDRLITNALWILVLAPAGATLSVDSRWRNKAWVDLSPQVAWPRYALLVQLCLVYSTTGIQKLGSSWFPWGGFSAVYYALLTPSWARYDMSAAAWLFPLTQVGTAVTWIWEVSFPMVVVWLWWRHSSARGGRARRFAQKMDLRIPYAVIGLTMHLVLFMMMNVGPFSLITTSFYIAMWHHDELARWLPRLGATGQGVQTVSPPG